MKQGIGGSGDRGIELLRVLAFSITISLCPTVPLLAQCPDGAPPPCRGQGGAAVRRPNPPLDDRTWIVLPFENVARVADIDWLKDASVNLLYLDMSKWHDIRVIDDERVADFIREVPEARGTLTLQSGMAVARRAGAGKLVMGDLLKVGNRTQLVAKVFDVRTGQRMRTVRQDAANADSIMPAYGLLARAVLNVAPPEGTSLGAIGTLSIGAYQDYIAGVGSLNRWQLDSAHAQFTRALALDSTFALAHYKLALVTGWQAAGDRNGPRHADAAVRLGGNLPTRERSLLAGYAAFANQHYADACAVFGRMIQADSSDVEAWYNLGECSYHDNVIVTQADTTRFAFRGSWNTSLRAFRKALDLDPTYHLAFQHIQDALLSGNRIGCRLAANVPTCTVQNGIYQAVVRRSGDSLLIEPVSVISNGAALTAQQMEAVAQHVRRRNLEDARRGAEAWLAAGPAESRPRMAYARILLRLGQKERADSVARLVSITSTNRVEASNFTADRMEIALKVGNTAEAARIADSLHLMTDTIQGARNIGLILRGMMGHPGDLRSAAAAINGPDWVKAYFTQQALALAGFAADNLFDAERTFARNVDAQAAGRAATLIAGTLVWTDPRARTGPWPVSDTANGDPRVALFLTLASGDTARFRRALERYDSIGVAAREEPDNGLALAGAYGHLAIADTAGALRWLRAFKDSTWARSAQLDQVGAGFAFQGLLWAKTFLLLGDLAAATGQRDEAVWAYRRFIGMWERGDAEVQPIVQRARAALARLGG